MSLVSPLAPPSSSAFPRCPGRRPGGLAGGRGQGSGRPGRRRRGQSQPRPQTEPVDCSWACGRRTGGARAGCGRERGHCVPHPPTPRGVMAQADFPRHLPGHSALAPRRLRAVEDWTSLPFSSSCLSPDWAQICLQTQLFLWGHAKRGLEGWVNFLSSLLSGEVQVDWSVAVSLFTSVRAQGPPSLPLFPQCIGLTSQHLPAPFPPSFPHVFRSMPCVRLFSVAFLEALLLS